MPETFSCLPSTEKVGGGQARHFGVPTPFLPGSAAGMLAGGMYPRLIAFTPAAARPIAYFDDGARIGTLFLFAINNGFRSSNSSAVSVAPLCFTLSIERATTPSACARPAIQSPKALE